MADLTVSTITRSGIAPTYVAAAALGDAFVNTGRIFLHVKNGGGGSINVTVAEQVTADIAGYTATDLVVAVPAGAERMIGPFPRSAYNDSNGKVQVSYSDETSVTVAALQL